MFRVLLVDDDTSRLETYSFALRRAGYETELADSAARCIAQLSTALRRDACLLDLNLGDGTGFDVLGWMRSVGLKVPTAVMTAFRPIFSVDKAIALGAVAYIDQPLDIEQLIDVVGQLVSPPSQFEPLESLHARVITGQVGAIECIAAALLRELPPRLKGLFPHVPRDFIIDAAEDAILEYAANPAKFDPLRHVSLRNFLQMAARRNLATATLAESRRKGREARYAALQPTVTGASHADAPRFDLWACVLTVVADPAELRAAKRWLDGDVSSDGLAEALGIADRAPAFRRREVKQFKDRLLKRISRAVRFQRPYDPSHG